MSAISTTGQIGQILSFEQLENNITNNIQDNFTSACAYFDVKRIVPNIQHFYILITAYVGVKQRINNSKSKLKKHIYKYYAATGTKINFNGIACNISYKDFYFKYMVKELLDTLKLFVANGFVLTTPTYNILIFLDIDISSIDHLCTLTQKEKKWNKT